MTTRQRLNYLLRSIDRRTWDRARRRAAREGYTIRVVLLRFIEQYAAE